MKEWRDVIGYEGVYKISNGIVKSLEREVRHWRGGIKIVKERILKQSVDDKNRCCVDLSNNGKRKHYRVHVLMAMAFLNHIPNGYNKIVDHIDNNPSNNRLDNLQIISNRENCSKDKKGFTSKYVGVCWSKNNKKWKSTIHISGKDKHLGYFDNELEAYEKYQEELKKII